MFSVCKAAWKAKGHHVCRHGVFFTCAQSPTCPCLDQPLNPTSWGDAKYMPAWSKELQLITTARFELSKFQRLGQLRASCRQSLR
eukprot:8038167-Karenia_brevis.AAC.1